MDTERYAITFGVTNIIRLADRYVLEFFSSSYIDVIWRAKLW